jgi:hypothetical protein
MYGMAAQPDIIDEAIRVVGRNPPTNRQLQVDRHVERLAVHAEAAPLVEVLKSAAVQAVFQRYDEVDATADSEQKAYKRSQWLLLTPLGVAVTVGLLNFMIPASEIGVWFDRLGMSPLEAEVSVRQWSTWAIFLSLFLVPLLALGLRPFLHYELWMRARATAEGLRRELFERVMAEKSIGRGSGTALPLLLLKLEYFRRYQMEIQSVFHDTRGRQHEVAANRARILRQVFILLLLVWVLLCIGANLSGLAEQGALPVPAPVSGLVAIATSWLQRIEIYDFDVAALALSVGLALIYAAVLLNSFLSSSVRNAARYKIMRENFRQLNDELGAVRAAAVQQDEAAVQAFVARVHSVMSLELADWVRLGDLDHGKDSAKYGHSDQRADSSASMIS